MLQDFMPLTKIFTLQPYVSRFASDLCAMQIAQISQCYWVCTVLDGIGMQCHFDGLLVGPDDILIILDCFAEHGVPIWAMEYDVAINNGRCGRFSDNFYTMLFSHLGLVGQWFTQHEL
jgi:hypothetical protein